MGVGGVRRGVVFLFVFLSVGVERRGGGKMLDLLLCPKQKQEEGRGGEERGEKIHRGEKLKKPKGKKKGDSGIHILLMMLLQRIRPHRPGDNPTNRSERPAPKLVPYKRTAACTDERRAEAPLSFRASDTGGMVLVAAVGISAWAGGVVVVVGV